MFVSVKTDTEDAHVKMRIHTCFTQPSDLEDQALSYTLIKDG